ncbi:MAG TPA: glycosyltransferase [Candidatus Limnocylindrales bacterium]|nr:glycosyltransferase [Candidatus Limnocylindrales bacterium]
MTRIAYLSYSSAEWDARTQRMARTAVDAGYDVTVYARWESGLPVEEDRDGYRVVRVPTVEDLAIPGRRTHGRKRLAGAYRRARNEAAAGLIRRRDREPSEDGAAGSSTASSRRPEPDDSLAWVPSSLRGTPLSGPLRAGRRILRETLGPVKGAVAKPVLMFPLRPMGWAIALEDVAEPADIWHGMWAGSLPALHRLRAKFGGRTIYDSRDVYMRSRGFEQMGAFKAPFAALERRYARDVDAVLTVNDAYASLLAGQFGIEPPPVVRNTPDRYALPAERPDHIRTALGLPRDTRVILYQGGLLSDRGIEQGMEAILGVENAAFVILGVGKPTKEMSELAASDRLQGRVHFLDPVPPDQLLDWTASADVMLMAIQPTSINHRFTTPQKLWEAIAAGVPVVATDLPGMAEVVRETGCGVLVEATDPADIARGIRAIVDAPAEERDAMRERTWRAGQERYNWQHEADTLLALYRELLGQPETGAASPVSASTSAT